MREIKDGEIAATVTYGFSLAFFLYLCFFLAGCGDPGGAGPLYCPAPEDIDSTASYIIDGEVSVDRRATVYVSGGGSYCTGTAIGPYTVLTAAHCQNVERVCLGFGSNCTAVSEDIVREGANMPGARDLRILHTLSTIPGPHAELGFLEDCDTYIAQGYGSQGGGQRADGQLWEREVNVCVNNYGVLIASQGICNGDSGGPLWCNNRLVGVSSFGWGAPNVCDGSTGFVNLDVDGNREWVEENVL